MLSLSYDYDVLSLGLLKNQARSMEVHLKEVQSGCLAHENSSCQDIAIANALMDLTRAKAWSGKTCSVFGYYKNFHLALVVVLSISAVLQANMVTTIRQFTVI